MISQISWLAGTALQPVVNKQFFLDVYFNITFYINDATPTYVNLRF